MAPIQQKNVTISDVARASGVSSSTVSRVLNGFAFIKDSTRQRVLETATNLGYVANVQARSLAGGKSQIIGMLMPWLDNAYCVEVAQSIDEVLSAIGYDLIVHTTRHKKGKEAQIVATLGNLSDGLLLMVPSIDFVEGEQDYLEILRLRHVPYVLIDQIDPSGQSTSVDCNNFEGAYEATQYLIKLGHRRIGFICGNMMINSAFERLEGYKAALHHASIEWDPLLVMQGDFLFQKASETTQQLLELSHRPTAIFASNDLSAFGVMAAIHHAGLKIPEDISVIGFDDIPQAATSYPMLTTVRQPLEQMGKLAVELLLEKINYLGTAPKQVKLGTQLIYRESCRARTW
jgi:LacI family transcriptional regulator